MDILPKLKVDLSQPLILSGAKENICYLVEEAPETPEFPKKGERFCILYEFHPSSGGYFGYEHLCVMAFREGANLVKYFTSLGELELYLGRMVFSIDKKYAEEQIQKRIQEIEKFSQDYGLVGVDMKALQNF